MNSLFIFVQYTYIEVFEEALFKTMPHTKYDKDEKGWLENFESFKDEQVRKILLWCLKFTTWNLKSI